MKKYQERLIKYTNWVLKPYGITAEIQFTNQMDSYSTFVGKDKALIVIGEKMFSSIKNEENKDVKKNICIEGVLNHEIGHLIFSQFERLKYCIDQAKFLHEKIKEDFNNLKEKTKKTFPKIEDSKIWETVFQNLTDTEKEQILADIHDYIYFINIKDMLNILEDAAIECCMPGLETVSQNLKNRIYESICVTRNYIYSKEKDGLSHKPQNPDDAEESLSICMSEIHELGVIGYREPTSVEMLVNTFGDEAKKIFDLVMYSKFATVNTEERFEVSKALMKYLDDFIKKMAETHFEKIQKSFELNSILDSLMSSAMDSNSNISISIPNGTASHSITSSKRRYDYEMPEEIKKERGMADSNQNEKTDDERDSDSSSGSKEQSENQRSKTSDLDSKNVSSEKAEQKEKNDSSKSNAGMTSKDLCEDSKNFSTNNFDDSQREATEAVKKIEKEEIAKAEKELQKSFEDAMEAKTSSSVVKDVPGICKSDCFERVRINITDVGGNHSRAGDYAYQYRDKDNKIALKVAAEINQVRIYNKRAKRINSRKGALKGNNLYRAMTDGKCFQKTTPGKEKNIRIALLMDLSGSMGGKKCLNAIRTAYTLANACYKAKVPICVWGHNTSGYSYVDINRFVNFGDRSTSIQNIYSAKCSGCNMDGLAILNIGQHLIKNRKRDEELFLLVLSDGSPNAGDYCGMAAEENIRDIIRKLKDTYKVHTLGVTIETNNSEIKACKRIYGDNTVVVPNSDNLAFETISILKKLALNN